MPDFTFSQQERIRNHNTTPTEIVKKVATLNIFEFYDF